MRKVFVAGAAGVALVAAAFVLAPAAWSQTRYADGPRERRVLMLDGRGSSIGVSIRDLSADDAAKAKLGQGGGVLIEDVNEGSPAAKAGLRDGDIVVEFDGERVRSARHFARLVQETAEGRSVKAGIVRDGSRQTVDVTPESRGPYAGDFAMPDIPNIEREIERGMRSLPRDLAFDFKWDGEFPTAKVWPGGRLGAQLSPLTDQLAEYFGAKQGVLVSSVDADSVAAKAGLKAGDVITAVNGRSVETMRDVTQALREADRGQEIELSVLRDKKSMSLKARMPEPRRADPNRPTRPV
jgi:serine protease Do